MDKIRLNLQLFADAGTLVNATGTYINAYTGAATPFDTSNTLTPGMKTFYNTALLENARSKYYFAQFGRRQPLPANNGMTVEWRKWNTLPDAGALTEGVIPTGVKMGQTTLTSGITQHGMYTTLSDLVVLHQVDNVLLGATEELGESAGRTNDRLIRAVLMEGTNVIYADTLDANGAYSATPTGRWGMTATNNRLTPDMVNQAVTFLKKQEAPQIDGKYIAMIHPSVADDLRTYRDLWTDLHKYAATTEIFNGEIGELHGVRFIETMNSKVWSGLPLTTTNRYLTCTTGYIANDSTATAPDGGETSVYRLTISETPAAALVGRYAHVYDASVYVNTVKIIGIDASNKYIWLDSALGISPTSSDYLYPGEGAAESVAVPGSSAVYATTFLGREAYGLIDPDGGGLRMIYKSAADIGGPLEQFSTAGYKFSSGTKILYQERMLRVESCSRYSLRDTTN